MKAILVQPPFVQLNAPYPAIHCLEAFLRGQGHEAVAYDHSIALYRRIFSRAGLAKVFAEAREALDGRTAALAASGAAVSGDLASGVATALQVERYLSYGPLYIEWIDGIVDFLSGRDPAMAHRLASAAEFPRGARAEAYLGSRGGRVGPDEAGQLATCILDDLGDFIGFALDPDFGTVRYAERLASSRADFSEVRASLDSSWLVREFYTPFLDEFWAARAAESPGAPPDLVLVTIPFPGCLLGALAFARAARKAFGEPDPGESLYGTAYPTGGKGVHKAPRIVFGGGYVSTELRGLCDSGIFDFCDYLSFDAGYGSLASILAQEGEAGLYGTTYRAGQDDLGNFGGLGERHERREAGLHGTVYRASSGSPTSAPPGTLSGTPRGGLYRTMYRPGGDGALVVSGFPTGDSAAAESGPGRHVVGCADFEKFARLEREAVTNVFPDYRSADFGSYLRIVDSGNAMHRLWSETPWLKYSLAHGCYWRRCSFCDTELEYVADFTRSSTGALLDAASAAAARTGLHGIHFVDEAMPMAALLDFARANRALVAGQARPFSYWGNVRFDATWTQGRCEFLGASGLVAVSGGIEIATERGLEMTGKGFDLASLVRTLVAMRRAGLLVHTYLIYGFPGQTAADIVDSAEFCRQLFASGLVDSAFWHRFVLTRHSRMYREWKEGKRPGLIPSDRAWSFANNDLSFEGERAFDRFDAPLAASLDAWMESAGLAKPLSAWFGRAAPKASIAGDLVESLIASAEAALDEADPDPKGRVYWLGGIPALQARPPEVGRVRLSWAYRGELRSIELPGTEAAARKAAALLGSPELRIDGRPYAVLETELGLPKSAMVDLLSAGLVVV